MFGNPDDLNFFDPSFRFNSNFIHNFVDLEKEKSSIEFYVFFKTDHNVIPHFLNILNNIKF